VLDVVGVDQPDLERFGLQQVKRSLPVVGGRLHHHPGHAQLPQPIGQHQQRAGHRLVGLNLLQPLATGARAWHPYATHQFRLADSQRGDSLDDLLGVVGLLQHPASSAPVVRQRCWLPTGAQGHDAKLIRVLKATVKGP
jgi:hypothetical protein